MSRPKSKGRLAKVYTKTEAGLQRYTESHLGVQNRMENLPKFQSGGAGLVSTMDDYAKFAQMLLQGGTVGGHTYLSRGTVDYFTSAQQSKPLYEEMQTVWEWMHGYNYGCLMRHCAEPQCAAMLMNQGEYGWDGWLGSVFINDPQTQTTLLLMQQQADGGFTPCARKVKNLLWREE